MCVCQILLPHVVALTQQSTYNNVAALLINRVSLDSSYCVIGVFYLGGMETQPGSCESNVSSWSTELCGNRRRLRLSDQKWDTWCGVSKDLAL